MPWRRCFARFACGEQDVLFPVPCRQSMRAVTKHLTLRHMADRNFPSAKGQHAVTGGAKGSSATKQPQGRKMPSHEITST